MAAFRILEDQENMTREFRQKAATSLELVQQRRSVLGVLGNKLERQPLGKQPLSFANTKFGKENVFDKQVCGKQQQAPPVPVAQFQAFKVYEDVMDEKIEKELRERQKRNRHKDDFSNVYKGTIEDRLVTKKEVQEKMLEQAMICNSPTDSRPTHVATTPEEMEPMSVEKSMMDEHDTCSIIAKSKTCRDAFFEMVEYRDEIFVYLKEKEKLQRPKPMYMRKQPDITYNMRTILVDWLVEVTEEYKLHTETLYLAVNFIDRFLSFMSVVRAKLQLVGTAAMFIAAKYEEIYPPDVAEFVYITDDTYTKRQVTRMEMLILRILDFNLSIPTTYTFIAATCISQKLQERVMYLAMYLSELSLLDAEPCLETLPSLMAAASLALARHYNGEEVWSNQLAKSTGYELSELTLTVKFLNTLLENAPNMPQQAIQEKYRQTKFLSVSDIKAKPLIHFS